MTNVQLSMLPLSSSTIQVTVVSPNGKLEPLAGVQLNAGLPSTLSDILMEKVTSVLLIPTDVLVVISSGHIGGSISAVVNNQWF